MDTPTPSDPIDRGGDVGPRLVLLGTGTALPTLERGPTGELLAVGRDVTLIDPGPGTVKRAFDAGYPPWSIARVLLTHHHVDHVLDLVALLFARINPFLDLPPSRSLGRLEILGGPGTQDLVAGFGALFGLGLLESGPGVEARDVSPGKVAFPRSAHAPPFAIEAFPITHSAPSLAYRITLPNGAILAISGDTGPCDGAVAVARDADHYLLESALPEDRRFGVHLTAREAGAVAARANCRHLILNHFYPQVDPDLAARHAAEAFGGRITIGRDGLAIPLVPFASRDVETPQ